MIDGGEGVELAGLACPCGRACVQHAGCGGGEVGMVLAPPVAGSW